MAPDLRRKRHAAACDDLSAEPPGDRYGRVARDPVKKRRRFFCWTGTEDLLHGREGNHFLKQEETLLLGQGSALAKVS